MYPLQLLCFIILINRQLREHQHSTHKKTIIFIFYNSFFPCELRNHNQLELASYKILAVNVNNVQHIIDL